MENENENENETETETELEKEFSKVAGETLDKISEFLDTARKALNAACKLSEENGIPFTSGISHISQSYIPSSLFNKWEDVDHSIVERETSVEAYEIEEYGGNGWVHSDVC
jgi:hypothetical protein